MICLHPGEVDDDTGLSRIVDNDLVVVIDDPVADVFLVLAALPDADFLLVAGVERQVHRLGDDRVAVRSVTELDPEHLPMVTETELKVKSADLGGIL